MTEPARLLGDSDAIEQVRMVIRRIGPTMAGVVVTGPSGAGRSLIAAAVHAASAGAGRGRRRRWCGSICATRKPGTGWIRATRAPPGCCAIPTDWTR
ncbi:sigma 54-interacting transcriptional regulator [Sphingomonas sp. I4]